MYACINQRWVSCQSTGSQVFRVKPGAQQSGEALVKLEGAALRHKIRMIDDEDLCRIIPILFQRYRHSGCARCAGRAWKVGGRTT